MQKKKMKTKNPSMKKHYIISLLILLTAIIFFVIGLLLLVTWRVETEGINEINGFDYINNIGLLNSLNWAPEQLQVGIIFGLIIAPIFFGFSFLYFIVVFLTN